MNKEGYYWWLGGCEDRELVRVFWAGNHYRVESFGSDVDWEIEYKDWELLMGPLNIPPI